MPTTRLYWDDPLLLSFDAPVLAHARLGERPALVFQATAFYPEAGGQMSDRGLVRWEGGEARVVDAQEDAEGRVLHALDLPVDAALPAIGAGVHVTIEEARRRDHMSQHTGQHMLSRALLDVAKADTVSSRLGESICTIDTSAQSLSDEALADAELLVARIVLEDRQIRQLRPTPEELARLPLRREPKVESNVRVIDIDGFDLSPCGGTHCQRTGQVGPVRIVQVERHKGGHRISFHAGLRAIRDDQRKGRLLGRLARELTCGADELPEAIEKLRQELKSQQRATQALRERLAIFVADELRRASGSNVVHAVLPGEGADFLRAVAARLCLDPQAIALLAAPGAEACPILFQRGAKATADMGGALKALAQKAGGRGGGRPDRAEGQLPAGADAAQLLAEQARILAAQS